MEPFWNTTRIEPGETKYWEIGPLAFWIRRIPGEWHLVREITADSSKDDRWNLGVSAEFPAGKEFERFSFDSEEDDHTLTLQPEFPDRSIVSKPNLNVVIPPGSRATFFCRVSLWVKLSAGSGARQKPLTTLPVANLSRTWFGTSLEGEACYASATNATRDYHDLKPYPYRVVCPVVINNKGSDALPFERICIRVKHLKIYQGSEYLWSNEIRVTKNNAFELSQVVYASDPPSLEPDAPLVAASQEKVSAGGILLRTFNNLRKSIDID